MEKTLVIFDVDGTLVYSNKIDSQCFAQAYKEIYDCPFPSIDWTKYPHVTDHTIFKTVIRQHFGRDATEAEMTEFQQHYIGLLEHFRVVRPEEFQEVPNAKLTIDNLRNDDRFVVGIATGGWQRPAHVKLNHVKIPAHELFLSGADGKETREEIIQQVIGAVQVQHAVISRVVYVGDAIWDVHTTRKLNMNFIGIRRTGDLEILEREGTKIVLQDFSNYERFVEAVFEAAPPAFL